MENVVVKLVRGELVILGPVHRDRHRLGPVGVRDQKVGTVSGAGPLSKEWAIGSVWMASGCNSNSSIVGERGMR